MHIEIDDLARPQVQVLLQEHLDNMHELSPPEHVFALDLARLRVPEITFWTIWQDDELLGCGALKELSPTHGEIKSMRTPAAARRRGAGRAILRHIIAVARQRGYTTLSLETGSHPAFAPAHTLYRSHGFTLSGPFGSYQADPHSTFMELRLADPAIRIRRVDHTDPPVARAIHAVQVAAYAQEATLLGAVHFPPLGRTVNDLRALDETFLAAYSGERMVGAISVQEDFAGPGQHICSLVVAPVFQRQGIARALLTEILRLHAANVITVHTGVENTPALALYAQFGFVTGRRWHAGPERLELVELQRTPQ